MSIVRSDGPGFVVLVLVLALVAACEASRLEGDGGMPDAATDAVVLPPPEVQTELGTVRGWRGDGFQAFLGIPYAEPPVGERRWRAPLPHPGWEGVLDATGTPSACPQDAFGLRPSGDEDCLFVNVHTPDPRPERAPVMVWIHGGGFVFGEGLQLDGGTAGDRLAARYGIVVVSMNYRLGPFGFLRSEALGSTGNEGILDQQLALRWVRDHIARFGGDPDAVTIVGESAGGLSVCLHLVAPGSRGLFHRAIIQSGLCDSALMTPAEADAVAARTIEAAGCAGAADVAACLRGKTTDEIQRAGALEGDPLVVLSGTERTFWPSVDGTVIPGHFGERVRAGELARVPAIVGWNADEGTLFVGLAELNGAVVDEAAYHRVVALLAAEAGLDPSAIEAAYPPGSYADPGAALADAIGDHRLTCPSRRAARLLAAQGLDVRVYRFEYPDAAFQLALPRDLGAFHSAEIQYVFGHPARIGRRVHVGDDLALFEAMSGYWARFVRSGDPNGEGAPPWPAHTSAEDRHLVLDRTIAAGMAADADACALWER